MQAINHIATALIVKRAVPSAPLLGLMVATEAVEFLWVGLNVIGVERTSVTEPGNSVVDVHLEYMPFSHSVLTNVVLAAIVGLLVFRFSKRHSGAVAIAMSAAVLSHIVLDLLTHAADIPLAPGWDAVKYGTGLTSNWPLVALAAETFWGLACWKVYGGSRALLVTFLAFAAISVPSYLPGVGAVMSAESFPLLILFQICVTILLVWIFARRRAA